MLPESMRARSFSASASLRRFRSKGTTPTMWNMSVISEFLTRLSSGDLPRAHGEGGEGVGAADGRLPAVGCGWGGCGCCGADSAVVEGGRPAEASVVGSERRGAAYEEASEQATLTSMSHGLRSLSRRTSKPKTSKHVARLWQVWGTVRDGRR